MSHKVTRREFVQEVAGVGVGAGLAWAATGPRCSAASEEGSAKGPKSHGKPADSIGYINPTIPEFSLPPYEGQRYEAKVPDTLDFGERARLAANALTGWINRSAATRKRSAGKTSTLTATGRCSPRLRILPGGMAARCGARPRATWWMG